MAQRYTAKLARLLENCEKKIKFLANNNITVESVAKEKEEKRKKIERHKRAILNMKRVRKLEEMAMTLCQFGVG